jgi:hypothetical protein
MTIINRIKIHKVLSKYIEDTCCENGICVSFDEAIDPNTYAIIKVDKFYNDQKLGKKTPASIDCLIVRECIKTGYGLTLVELKKIESGAGFEVDNMKRKFETTLYDFIKKRFKVPLDIDYSEIKLFFVSKQEIYKRDIGLKMEVLINTRFKFNDRNLMIRPVMPTPTIKQCYS